MPTLSSPADTTPLSDMTTQRRDLGLTMIRLVRRWRGAMDDELRKFGLTSATWRPLYHLGRLGEGVRATDLAEALEVEPPSMVRLLDRLEKGGFITRGDSPDDRRCKIIQMTEKGREVQRRTVEAGLRVGAALTARISDQEIMICMDVFTRIAEDCTRLAQDQTAERDDQP